MTASQYQPISILDASANGSIFSGWFRNRASWAPWFAFLAVLFGLPLTAEQLTLYQACTGRTAPPVGPFYECWLIAVDVPAKASSLP
jgi:hypothetical protein